MREETFKCYHCRDLGVRLVFSDDAVKAVLDWPVEIPVEKKTDRRLSRVYNVACECGAGERWADPPKAEKGRQQSKPVARFDSDRCVPITSSSPSADDIATLVDFVETLSSRMIGWPRSEAGPEVQRDLFTDEVI